MWRSAVDSSFGRVCGTADGMDPRGREGVWEHDFGSNPFHPPCPRHLTRTRLFGVFTFGRKVLIERGGAKLRALLLVQMKVYFGGGHLKV